jgi:hypothetical protein
MSVRYQRAESALWRRSADAVVVLPLDGTDVFVLRGSGSAVWDVLQRARTLNDAAAVLAETFSRPADAIATEIQPVLRELVQRKAVVES